MAKSSGNLVLADDLLKDYPAAAIRLLILDRPWDADWDYDQAGLDTAAARLERLQGAAAARNEARRGPVPARRAAARPWTPCTRPWPGTSTCPRPCGSRRTAGARPHGSSAACSDSGSTAVCGAWSAAPWSAASSLRYGMMAGMPGEYRLYQELADWWPLISPPGEYAAEAAYLAGLFTSADIEVRDVLDLGSGGGHVAVHLKDRLNLTLVNLSAGMLAVSRRLNPKCAHRQGDMRTVRLGRMFDAVLVHDAVNYVTDEDDLRQLIATAFAHCRPGGMAVFVPDYTAETSSRHGRRGEHRRRRPPGQLPRVDLGSRSGRRLDPGGVRVHPPGGGRRGPGGPRGPPAGRVPP